MNEKLKPTIRIPVTLEDITAEWLTEALAPNYPGVEVISTKVSNFIGHKQNKARVAVTYNAAGMKAGLPPSFFIKGSLKEINKISTVGLEGGRPICTACSPTAAARRSRPERFRYSSRNKSGSLASGRTNSAIR